MLISSTFSLTGCCRRSLGLQLRPAVLRYARACAALEPQGPQLSTPPFSASVRAAPACGGKVCAGRPPRRLLLACIGRLLRPALRRRRRFDLFFPSPLLSSARLIFLSWGSSSRLAIPSPPSLAPRHSFPGLNPSCGPSWGRLTLPPA